MTTMRLVTPRTIPVWRSRLSGDDLATKVFDCEVFFHITFTQTRFRRF